MWPSDRMVDCAQARRCLEAMTTKEKLQAQNLASDGCVDALKSALEETPKYTLFLPRDFEEIWAEYNISGNQRKHKLAAAVLKKIAGRI